MYTKILFILWVRVNFDPYNISIYGKQLNNTILSRALLNSLYLQPVHYNSFHVHTYVPIYIHICMGMCAKTTVTYRNLNERVYEHSVCYKTAVIALRGTAERINAQRPQPHALQLWRHRFLFYKLDANKRVSASDKRLSFQLKIYTFLYSHIHMYVYICV